MSLTGIDIASYQAALNLATAKSAGAQFAIIKATEGTSYVNPSCDPHYQQAKTTGLLRGVYHFARNRSNSAAAEAAFFVKNVKGYIGDAIFVLDWEDGSGVSDVAWAKAWLDAVCKATGVRPLIYMSASPASAYDWSSVSRDYGLWIAGYPNSRPNHLTTPDVPYAPGHGWNIAIWQYTSSGQISGYSGNLDMNVAYMDASAWGKYAGGGNITAPTGKADIRAIQAAVHATQDNVAGPDTRVRVSLVAQASAWGGRKFPNGVKATQQVVGTTPDGSWGPKSIAAHDATVIAIQEALNALGYAIAVDGIWGDHTEAAVTDALNRAEQP
jgi:GH25 family lysozyme M1 (1,4-beta-N-acetylmuramidase)